MRKRAMTEFKIKLADIPIKVKGLYPYAMDYCRDYLCDEDCRYEIRIDEKDIEYERSVSTLDVPDAYLETLTLYRKIAEQLIDENVILFHSSVIELDGEAYAFAAPSGTGKSTHVRLWREYFRDRNVRMINDDKPLLKVTDEVRAYGTPWMGQYGLGENISSPVKGICFLSQGEENRIEAADMDRALSGLLRQTYRSKDRDKLIKTLELIRKITELVPVYEMECTISSEAVTAAYEAMKG